MYLISHFPCHVDYTINFDNENKIIKFTTNDIKINDNKITVKDASYFMEKIIENNHNLILDLFNKHSNLKNNNNYKFCDIFVCLEDFRNISYGFINNLINDNSNHTINKIGDFGYLAGKSKPARLSFIDLSNKYPNILEYIATPKYNPSDPRMITFNDMKKYKYLIDLPGHTYSTKIYSYLHCKRVVFRVKNRKRPFKWEEILKPNVHFIEIENDYSDLIEKFEYLESNPTFYNEIVKNCETLITDQISQQILIDSFLNTIFTLAST